MTFICIFLHLHSISILYLNEAKLERPKRKFYFIKYKKYFIRRINEYEFKYRKDICLCI
jgi:hypothetical protein